MILASNIGRRGHYTLRRSSHHENLHEPRIKMPFCLHPKYVALILAYCTCGWTMAAVDVTRQLSTNNETMIPQACANYTDSYEKLNVIANLKWVIHGFEKFESVLTIFHSWFLTAVVLMQARVSFAKYAEYALGLRCCLVIPFMYIIQHYFGVLYEVIVNSVHTCPQIPEVLAHNTTCTMHWIVYSIFNLATLMLLIIATIDYRNVRDYKEQRATEEARVMYRREMRTNRMIDMPPRYSDSFEIPPPAYDTIEIINAPVRQGGENAAQENDEVESSCEPVLLYAPRSHVIEDEEPVEPPPSPSDDNEDTVNLVSSNNTETDQ